MRRKLEEFSTVIMGAVITLAVLTWLTASQAVKVAMPILVYSAIGLTILVGLIYATRLIIFQWLSTKKEASELSRDAHLAKSEIKRSDLYLEAEGQMLAAQINQMRNGMSLLKTIGDVHFDQYKKADPALLPATIETPKSELMPALTNCANILVVGAKGSGKTTLLQHLNRIRQMTGKSVVFDSHDHPAKWGGPHCHVIGNGRNYEQIWQGMMNLIAMLQKRYVEYSSGTVRERQHENITNFIDEFTALPSIFKKQKLDIQSYTLPLLTEGRKISLDIVWGVHSERVKFLGLESAGDLKECFDCVVYLRSVKNHRYALCDFGEGKEEIEYTLPGPFIIDYPLSEDVQSEPLQIPTQSEPAEPTNEEMAVLVAIKQVQMDNNGKVIWSHVTENILGWGKGSNQTQKAQAIANKWDVSY